VVGGIRERGSRELGAAAGVEGRGPEVEGLGWTYWSWGRRAGGGVAGGWWRRDLCWSLDWKEREGSGEKKWGHEEKAIETTVAFRHCQKDHHASGSIGQTRIEGSDEPTSPRALFSTWVILMSIIWPMKKLYLTSAHASHTPVKSLVQTI
jgi:hypothetical protein